MRTVRYESQGTEDRGNFKSGASSDAVHLASLIPACFLLLLFLFQLLEAHPLALARRPLLRLLAPQPLLALGPLYQPLVRVRATVRVRVRVSVRVRVRVSVSVGVEVRVRVSKLGLRLRFKSGSRLG